MKREIRTPPSALRKNLLTTENTVRQSRNQRSADSLVGSGYGARRRPTGMSALRSSEKSSRKNEILTDSSAENTEEGFLTADNPGLGGRPREPLSAIYFPAENAENAEKEYFTSCRAISGLN